MHVGSLERGFLGSPDRTRWDAFLSMFFVVYLWKPVSKTELKKVIMRNEVRIARYNWQLRVKSEFPQKLQFPFLIFYSVAETGFHIYQCLQ